MPTNDPIGSLFQAAGLAPVRSTPKSSAPADATKDAPQPTREFLSSLRKVQRDGAGSLRTPTTPDNDGKVATPKDPAAPEARQTAPNEADSPPPDAAPADSQSVLLAAVAAEADAAAEATAAVVAPEPQVAPTDSIAATDVPPPEMADELPRPVPSQNAPPVRRSVSAMPSALQEWLSAKPATAAKVETTASAAPIVPEAAAADAAPGDATTPMPPGLQMALSAVMAAQGATQSGSLTKASTDTPVGPVSATQPEPIVVAAVAPASVTLSESGPTAKQAAPEIPAAVQELPAQVPSTMPLPVAAPAAEVVVMSTTAAPVATAKEKPPAATQDTGTPTAPTVSPLAIPVPAVTVPQAAPPTAVKTGDVPQAVNQVAAAVSPQELAAIPEISTAAGSSASSVRKADSTQAPLEISADALTESSTGTEPIAFAAIATPGRGEQPSAPTGANEAVRETVLPAAVAQDAAAPQPADGSSLGPLTAGRNESPAVATPTAPVIPVSPHDSQALVDRVSQLVLKSHDSGQQLSLQITPPDLGTVRIEVHSHGGVLTARLEADTPAARQLLAEHLPQLREALQQQGANVDRIDVYQSDRAAQGEGMADSNWQSSQQEQRDEAGPLLYDDEDSAEPVAAQSRGSLALGELNIRI